MSIHPTAIIDPAAKVPESCTIGPYCVVGSGVELGENNELVAHVVLQGPAKLGDGNKLFPFASIGMGPQDLSYKGEPTRLEVGDRNHFREYVTVHRGTTKGGGLTHIGSDCLIMAYAHIAHDCYVGNKVIMANAATLAGHVTVEDFAVVGALSPVHQFVRIGTHAYIGGGTTITQDVLPFSKTVASRNVSAYGANSIGLRRRGFSEERIRRIHHVYKVLLASKLNTSQALAKLKSEGDQGEDVAMLIEWIEKSERGVIK
ncbi:MAG TPA: acyl-ACP--UDP-N-acetylglucosamine O-acyltransferase [Terriglobales bacterium]|nr:acyl-ACP--UDP-N-acetylglucosamine O-acyltransferase [Terriglobales bacterium]